MHLSFCKHMRPFEKIFNKCNKNKIQSNAKLFILATGKDQPIFILASGYTLLILVL